MTKLRIFLADDHAVVREGLKTLVNAEDDMRVIGEAANGRDAITGAGVLGPDIAVFDVSMPGMNGAEATLELKAAHPGIKVLALTVHEDRSYVRALLEAGAAGYVLKRAAADELIRAIRTIAAGGVYVDPHVAGKLIAIGNPSSRRAPDAPVQLSERETSVLRLIAQGYSNKEIAGQLGVSVKTVETYKARSMEKLDLRSRVDIVRYATQEHWLEDC